MLIVMQFALQLFNNFVVVNFMLFLCVCRKWLKPKKKTKEILSKQAVLIAKHAEEHESFITKVRTYVITLNYITCDIYLYLCLKCYLVL